MQAGQIDALKHPVLGRPDRLTIKRARLRIVSLAVQPTVFCLRNKALRATFAFGKHATHASCDDIGRSEMDKDRIAGSAKAAGGKMKESAGKMMGNKKMQAEGMAKKAEGKLQN